MIDFDKCQQCGVELKKVRHPRTSPKNCYDCRPARSTNSVQARKVFADILKNKPNSKDTELGDGSIFEDCPKAVAEYEMEKDVNKYKYVIKEVNFGTSPINDMVITGVYKKS